MLNINILLAINIENHIKEVKVYIHDMNGIRFVERTNKADMYIEYRDKIFFLKKTVFPKKGGTSTTGKMEIINSKKIYTKKTKQHYEVTLSCLKSNNVYFNCTEY